MSLSRIEAVLFAVMVGASEAYFVADGVRHGATSLELGLLVALPLAVGSLGPVIVVWALSRWPRRKPLVVGPVLVQVASLATLAAAEGLGVVTPVWLIAFSALHQIMGQAAGVAWSSWYGDVVPARLRGRYFSRRNRWAHLASCLSVIACGLCLDWLEPGGAGEVRTGAGGAGYLAIFGLAAVSRLASAILLMLSPEPSFEGLADLESTVQLFKSEEGLSVRRMVLIACLLNFTVYVGSPYFGPFQLEVLHFSYVEYTASTVMVVLVKFLTMNVWGRAIDRYGARSIFLLAAVGVAIVPVPWLFASGLGMVLFAQSLSGITWGGYEVSHFTLLLETADAKVRPALVAAMNTANGLAQLAGSMLGGVLLHQSGQVYQLVFAVSTIGRLVTALLLAPMVPALKPGIGRRRLLLRLMGFRVSGGVAQGSISVDEEKRPKLAGRR
jgi:MFS family permease